MILQARMDCKITPIYVFFMQAAACYIIGSIMKRSVIIMPNWIGDFVLALSVVLHKARAENADMTLLSPAPLIPLATLLCGLSVIPYKRKTREEFRSTVAALRQGRFEKIYILPPSFSSAWCAYRTAIPLRRGLARELRGLLLTEKLPPSLRNAAQHITYEYSLVLETDYNPPHYWQPVTIDRRREFSGVIVLCPGSKYGPAKKWPWFRELAMQFPKADIILLGDKEETEAGLSIEAALPGRVNNLIGKTTLVEAAAIIAAAGVVISNDSGLMHLAGFLGAPVVGIFGSTSPVWTMPIGKKTDFAKIPCPCSPCFRRTCRYGHYNCLTKLLPELVISKVNALIARATL